MRLLAWIIDICLFFYCFNYVTKLHSSFYSFQICLLPHFSHFTCAALNSIKHSIDFKVLTLAFKSLCSLACWDSTECKIVNFSLRLLLLVFCCFFFLNKCISLSLFQTRVSYCLIKMPWISIPNFQKSLSKAAKETESRLNAKWIFFSNVSTEWNWLRVQSGKAAEFSTALPN